MVFNHQTIASKSKHLLGFISPYTLLQDGDAYYYPLSLKTYIWYN